MSTSSTTEHHPPKPLYHTTTDLFLWHQYQGDRTNDCAAFSIAIVANAILNRLQFDGSTVALEMEKVVFVSQPLPHLTLRKIPGWASLPWGISGYLKGKGIPARLRWLGSIGDLLRNIQEDRFTIVLIGEPFSHEGLRYAGWAHAKVLYGYEPPTGPEATGAIRPRPGFYFVDPGFEKHMSGLPHLPEGVFWQDEAKFKEQWYNMLRVCIEAGPKVTT